MNPMDDDAMLYSADNLCEYEVNYLQGNKY
jgi:hypothetical protein